MSGPVVRAAQWPQDEAACVSFIAALQAFERAIEPNRRVDPAIGAEYFRVLMKRVAEGDGRVFIAEESGRPIGWMVTVVEDGPSYVVEEERRTPFVVEIFVVERARGQGVGRTLLQAAEGDFRARGFRQMMIGVLAANAPARRTYERFGFGPYVEIRRKRF